MISITTKELEIEIDLKKKIEFICDFCNTTPTIINDSIREIELLLKVLHFLRLIILKFYILVIYQIN